MRSTFSSRARRWIGASALAILAGIGGGTALVAATMPSNAQQEAKLVPAAQIVAPAVTTAPNFADLVEAVKPAVVSIVVEGNERESRQLQRGGRQFNFNFPQRGDLPGKAVHRNNPFSHDIALFVKYSFSQLGVTFLPSADKEFNDFSHL